MKTQDTNFDIASRNLTGLEISERDKAEFEALRAQFAPVTIKVQPSIGDRVEINGYSCSRELLGEKGTITSLMIIDRVRYANVKLDNAIEGLNDNTANLCLADIHPVQS